MSDDHPEQQPDDGRERFELVELVGGPADGYWDHVVVSAPSIRMLRRGHAMPPTQADFAAAAVYVRRAGVGKKMFYHTPEE